MHSLRLVATLGVAVSAAAAGPARAQQPVEAPPTLTPFVRIVAGALNPGALDAATMAAGLEAGLTLGGRTMLAARALRQSQDRNSGADLTRNARDIFSLLLEHTTRPDARRRQSYVLRLGAGVMVRSRLPAAPVATLGLGVRYPIYRSLTLAASFEDDVAALPAGSYSYDYYDPAYLGWIHVDLTAKEAIQHNFGFLLALEWRP